MTTNKTGRITGTEMEEAISRFERDCRSDGVGETVRSFIREPLFIWMDALAPGIGRERFPFGRRIPCRMRS